MRPRPPLLHMVRRWRARFQVSVAPALALALLAGCDHAKSTTAPSGGWVNQQVAVTAGGVRVYGTLRHPVQRSEPVPGVLLLAGSGPTDRNGNSPLEAGPVDTLSTLSTWLSSDGVASLRYDKLGSGRTGLGPYAAHPDAVGIRPFEQEAAAGLALLAHQPGIDRSRLMVMGHSEGALFALLVATGRSGPVPRIRALGLLEPLAERYLDVISAQVQAQVAAQVGAGALSSSLAAQVDSSLARAVHQLRRSGTVPPGLPYGLASVLSPASATFLYQADQFDPATLAASLPRGMPVLVSCSNADRQVTCPEVDHLDSGLRAAGADVDFIHLTDVDHVLKVDPTGAAANYTKPLPFSPQLRSALAAFIQSHLG
jgi:acetyl esterase/lipase